MGVLKCACGAEAEGKDFEEADTKINHGIALSLTHGCSGDPTRMTWDAQGGYNKDGRLIVKNPKPVASREVVMLVGKKPKESKEDEESKPPPKPEDPLKKERNAIHKAIAESKLSAKEKKTAHETADKATSKEELNLILKSGK